MNIKSTFAISDTAEIARLEALHDYNILDTIPEEEYDNFTKIAARICNAPVSLITFLDKDRQWFKSHLGINLTETPRELSFCNYTILDPANVLVIPDMRTDKRFSSNQLVTGEPNAVFYAGAPLITPDGFALGSICVLDDKAGNLDDGQRIALKALAEQIITRLELQKKLKELKTAEERLRRTNNKLNEFANMVSHDMKTPLANILLITRCFKARYGALLDSDSEKYLDLINNSSKELLDFISLVLKQSKKIDIDEASTDSSDILNKVINMVALPSDIEIIKKGKFPKVRMDSVSLQQVFQNLITNAIKYNDKEKGIIKISVSKDDDFCYFRFQDNGTGIDQKHLADIFNERKTLNKIDRFGNKGTGMGLAAVKHIIEEIGGNISVSSEKNIGSVFKVALPATAVA